MADLPLLDLHAAGVIPDANPNLADGCWTGWSGRQCSVWNQDRSAAQGSPNHSVADSPRGNGHRSPGPLHGEHPACSRVVGGAVIPGGWVSERLRMDRAAVKLVRNLIEKRRVIPPICRGGWAPTQVGGSSPVSRRNGFSARSGLRRDLLNSSTSVRVEKKEMT